MPKRINRLNTKEFIFIMAVLMSVTALSIDAMIPALGLMTTDLNVQNTNDIQMVITSVFFGMSFGIMIYGPFADSFGRKTAIYLGVGIFLIGTLVSIYATNLETMLVGRAIQGFGSAACRVVSLAIIRDKYEGVEMAKIMSLIMMVFIMVPALAPLLGQGILIFASWQAIFWFIFVFALLGVTWMHFRQRETLDPKNRRSFSFSIILSGSAETVKNPVTLGYTVMTGILFGSFVAYLSLAQQIMEVQYNLGDAFVIYFGVLALAYGTASFLNARLLGRFSVHKICFFFLTVHVVISLSFFALSVAQDGNLPFSLFYIYMLSTFFSLGALFGNFNSLALQPFGHMAGISTSVISAIQTFLAVIVGGTIGQLYNGTVQPLIISFLVCGFITLGIFVSIRSRSEASLLKP
tara:strand:- start:82764 stop:83984 length:1221 start_codon:yes stop_codon:yes gene_type:complete